jgi:ABC-2 type transport system ATP-binding protein
VALIDHSKKILEGAVADIRESRKTGEIAIKFRGSMIAFVNALWTNFDLVDKEILGDDRFIARLKTRGETNFDDLLRAMMGQVRIEAVWEVLPSMQDIFIELVTPKPEGTHA